MIKRHNLLFTKEGEIPGIVKRQEIKRDSEIEIGYSYPEKIVGVRKREVSILKKSEIIEVITPYDVINKFYKKGSYPFLDEIIDFSKKNGINLGIFGSLALEIVTEKRYFDEGSDLDILIEESSKDILVLFYNYIKTLEKKSALLIDVEVEMKNGYGIKLKECFNNTKTVLGKGLYDVTFIKNLIL